MLHTRLAAACFVLLTALNATAFAQQDDKRNAAAPRISLVPAAPFDIVHYCLDVTDATAAKRIGDLEGQYYKERQERTKVLEDRLGRALRDGIEQTPEGDARVALQKKHLAERQEGEKAIQTEIDNAYTKRLLPLLDAKARKKFAKVSEIARVYRQALDEAKVGFNKVWLNAFDEVAPVDVPTLPRGFLSLLPGLSQEERSAVDRVSYGRLEADCRAVIANEMRKEGLTAPADSKDLAARQKYEVRARQIGDKVLKQLEPRCLAAFQEALPKDTRPKFEAVFAAAATYRIAQEKALDKAGRALAGLLSEDKLRRLQGVTFKGPPGSGTEWNLIKLN